MSLKKGILRGVLGLTVLVLVLLVGGYVFVHTSYFKRMVISRIAEKTKQSTGEELSIGNVLIHWTQLKVDLYDVVLRKSSLSPPPFFSCAHLGLSVKILSLWRHKFELSEVVLNRPVLDVVVTRHGESNLPHPPATPSASGSSTADEIFDLGIGNFVVTSGEINYDDQKYPVSADLRDLQMTSQFDVPRQIYRGTLAYDHGRVSAPQALPFEHSLQMEFAATRSTLRLTALRISTGRTRLKLNGTVADYAHPRVEATYQAAIFTPDLSRILRAPSIPAGEVWTSGSLRYDSASNQPFLDTIYAQGRLDSPNLLAHLANVYVNARRLEASYVLEHGNILVSNASGEALGGSLAGTFSMADLATKRAARLNATVRGASLAELMRFAPSKKEERARLAGKTNAEVQAAWAGPLSSIVTHVRATIYGPLRPPSPNVTPINGLLDLRYDAPRDTVTFAGSNLRTENTSISFDGTISRTSSLSVNANVTKLDEISRLVSSVAGTNNGLQTSSLAALELRGSAQFAGRVHGSPESPRIRGHVQAEHVFVKGTYLSSVTGGVDVGPSGLSVQNARMQDTMNGVVTLNGHLGLRDWSFTRTSPISLQVKASGLSVPDLTRIVHLKYHVPGKLDADISVHGSEENPGGKADISMSGIPPRNANPIRKTLSMRKLFTMHLEGNGNLIHATAQLTVKAGKISSTVAFSPKTEHYNGEIKASSLDLSKLRFVQDRGLELTGIASFSASGDGTIKRPQLAAHLEIPTFQIQDQTISRIHAQVEIANQNATFALNSTVVGGYVQAKGNVALKGNYPATASLDVRALPLGPLLATYVPRSPQGLNGRTELHAVLSGPLKEPKEIRGHIQIPSLSLGYQAVHIDLVKPMNLQYENGLISISRTEIKGSGTDLTVQGSIPLSRTEPLNVSANGSIDLALLQSLGEGIQSSGRVMLNIAAQGAVSHPTMRGEIQVASATLISATLPVAVESLNGRIRVSGTRLDIEQLQGTLGGGHMSATGFLDYGAHSNFNLALQAQSVRIRYPEGIRTLLDANLNLAGSRDSSSVTGKVLVDRLSFTQQFDIAGLIGQFNSPTFPAGPPNFEQDMKLNVALASTQSLNVTNSKLSIGGNFNLTLRGTAADPVVLGRVALTQGQVFFLGKRYEIQSGTIEFANPVRTEPVLNIYAKTTIDQYDITLNFVGPIDRLRTNYTSNPPLSSADIIHLLAFGTTAVQAATTPSTPASVAAESVLAQGVGSQVSGKLEKLTGISQITIDPLVTNSQANPGSQLAVQEQISGSLLLTFSTSVTDTQADTVEVQYTTPQHVKISVLRDYNGGYALDVRFRKTF